jgi:thiol-disulfide isomerase/thioredoxin
MSRPMATAVARLPIEGKLPHLDRATGWLNTPRLRPADLKGKVVLVDFWTYTCINWRRTLPYLRAWSQKYSDQGLVVLGVHTPEFSFEKDIDTVRRIAKAQGVEYPIAIDSDYAIWDAFNNNYWPALYFVDAEGRIRHHQFGEGEYEKLESIIQQLLAEAGKSPPATRTLPIEANGAEAAADWNNIRSPETYLGYARMDSFVSPGGGAPDRARVYSAPAMLKLNQWALTGNWTIKREFAVSRAGKGSIAYRFHARDVHLVMAPETRGKPVRFHVTVDGKPPGEAHGVDIDAEGRGIVDEPRMYQLIRQRGPVADRQFEVEFLDTGAEVYAFTFG